MKPESIRLIKDVDKSFIVYHEKNPFSPWHHHPEIELVLITKGKGKRMVGDHIDRFRHNDLVLVGSFLPHVWLCDQEYYQPEGFHGEGIVYQFQYDFLGPQFFEIPEHKPLKRLLEESTRGLKFTGKTKEMIISHMLKGYKLEGVDRLYTLFSIFRILSRTNEYNVLASPGFIEPFHKKGNEPMQKVIEYILQNFHKLIKLKDMLEITNMSNTAFSTAFKKSYRVTFKEYLLKARIGYACRLLTDHSTTISQIAYDCGFENLSNFNRQFKKLKGLTPSQYQQKAENDRLIQPKQMLRIASGKKIKLDLSDRN